MTKSARSHYYSVTRKMLLLAGQWPFQERRTKLFGVSLLTIINISFLMPQIKDLTEYLYSDWEKLKDTEEYEIMETHAMKARLLSLIYCIYIYIASIMFVSVSLIPHIVNNMLPVNESWPIFMPYESDYCVDGEEYFFYIFSHAFVGILIIITGLIGHDCVIMTYIEHVCSVFAVAEFRFKTMVRDTHDVTMVNNLDKKYNRKIAISVHAHWRALRFAELLEETFCIGLGMQIMITTIAISVTLLQVAKANLFAETARNAAFVLGQIIHLFIISLQGQKLMDYSTQIGDNIYSSSWYKMPVKSQRMLLFAMRRSLQPNFLSAGKIYIFSLKSFTTVVQTSVSYFTVLASFQ
ncbi:hypothetical protein P5V15_008473 [Pogonomyrmex californicus]